MGKMSEKTISHMDLLHAFSGVRLRLHKKIEQITDPLEKQFVQETVDLTCTFLEGFINEVVSKSEKQK